MHFYVYNKDFHKEKWGLDKMFLKKKNYLPSTATNMAAPPTVYKIITMLKNI